MWRGLTCAITRGNCATMRRDGRVALVASLAVWLCGCTGATAPTPAAGAATTPAQAAAAAPAPRILYLTHSAGYRHDVLPLSAQILQDLGRLSHAFDVTATDDCAAITRDNLTRFDAVVFFTSGDLPMSADQKAALLDFVQGGKGFVGIHSATDTFYGWPEYGALVGAYFDGHPWHQPVTLRVEDPSHPATAALSPTFQIADEIYQFRTWSRRDVHVLLALDPASVDLAAAGVNRADRDFALAWTRTYGRGRVFYTALGHEPAVWQDARFQQHLAGGIGWAIGGSK